MKTDRTGRALVLFAHGSTRADWRAPLDALCASVQAQADEGTAVRLAFLERCPPSLGDAIAGLVEEGFRTIDVLPLFISAGGHVKRDLPQLMTAARLAHPAATLLLHPAIGAHPAIAAAIAGLVGTGAD